MLNLNVVKQIMLVVPVFLFASLVWAQPTSEIIKKEVAEYYKSEKPKEIDEAAREAEIYRRTMLQNLLNSSIGESLYTQGTPTLSSDAKQIDTNFIVNTHFQGRKNSFEKTFCDQSLINEGGNDFSCQQDPLVAEADLKFGSLSGSAVLDALRLDGVRALLRNFSDPFPSTTLQNPEQLKIDVNDPKEMPKVAKILAAELTKSVARQPIVEMVVKRMADPSTQKSLMQRIEKESMQRFLNSKWYEKLEMNKNEAQKANPTLAALIDGYYEGLKMQALQTWLLAEIFKQNELSQVLLATQIMQNEKAAGLATGVSEQSQGVKVTPGGEIQNPNQPQREKTGG